MSFEAKGYKEFVGLVKMTLMHAHTAIDLYRENRAEDAKPFVKAYKECMFAIDSGLKAN